MTLPRKDADATEASQASRTGGAILVAAGIFFSRVFGLVRERVFAHYLGNSPAAAAFKAALRIPNFLQNLFGEGVLSASFIPVYAGLVGEGRREEADRVAGATFGFISLILAMLTAAGLAFTPAFIDIVAPGFEGSTRDLCVTLVRVIFPGTAVLVYSAWCLGILNSHRRFFLSYAAPVLWNAAIIMALFFFGGSVSEEDLAVKTAYGVVAGGVLQFLVQIPAVVRLMGRFRPSLSAAGPVRRVLKNFVPAVLGRGVVQVSAYVEVAYASLISERALSALAYAQTLYLIPISLFGMAVSAAELPEMSRAQGSPEDVARALKARVGNGLGRIAFFVIPSAVAFFSLGDVVGGALLQTGRFTPDDTRYLWYLLMGSSAGLFAATSGRLYASAFFALGDARTPLYFATLRVALTAALAYAAAVKLPGLAGLPREWGGVGLTTTTALAAWIEFLLLRRALSGRVGRTGLAWGRAAALWGSALCAAAAGVVVKWALASYFGPATVGEEWGSMILPMPEIPAALTAAAVLLPYAVVYLALTSWRGVPEAKSLLSRFARVKD